ncbi:MAG: hypothetical protein AAFZ65_03745 [Planctomycetota bacterium]
MIRRLRRRHRVASVLLIVLSFASLGFSLVAAPERTLLSELANDDPGPVRSGTNTLLFVRDTDGMANTVLAVDHDAGVLEVLSATGALAPDLLVYASAVEGDGRLPSDARLIGSLVELRRAPRPIAADAAHLYVFSLGHGALVEHFELSD